MARTNREWQSFSERWRRSSAFEGFLFWSVLVHIACAFVILLPVQSVQREKETLRTEKKRLDEEKKEKQEKLEAEAKKEIQIVLKKEIAEDELKPLFEEMTGDFLDEQIAEEFWDELLEELDFELEELAQSFDDPQQFDPIDLQEQVQKLKEKMVVKLADLAAEKKLGAVQSNVMKRAELAAKQLAAFYKTGLAEKVAQPVGAEFAKSYKAVKSAAENALKKADAELGNLYKGAQDALAKIESAKSTFEKSIPVAKDKKAWAVARPKVQEKRVELMKAAQILRGIQSKLKITALGLGRHLPSAAEHLKQVEGKHGAGAAAVLQKALKSAAEGKLPQAVADTKSYEYKAKKIFAAMQRVHAAVKLQMAAGKASLTIGTIGKAQKNAKAMAAGVDDKKKGELTKQIAIADSDLKSLEKQIGDANAVLRMPFAKDEKTKPIAGKSIDDGKKELAKSKASVAAKKFEVAAKELGKAGEGVKELGKEIGDALAKLGLDKQNTPDGLLAKLDALNKGKLADETQKLFLKNVQEKTIPLLMKKLDAMLKDISATKGTAYAKMILGLKNKVAKKLETALLKQLNPKQLFADQAGKQMPSPTADQSKTDANVNAAELAAKMGTKGKQMISRSIPLLVQSGLRSASAAFPKLKIAGGSDVAALLNRLGNLQSQLAANRKDFLGQSSVSGIAAARKRHLSRNSSIARGRGLATDAKAYRKMIEKIKGRGRIVGEDLGLQGTQGDASKAEEENTLRPALLAYEEPAKETTDDGKAVERNIEQPKFKTHRFAGVPFLANDAVKIDGDLSDWKDVPPLELDPVVRGGTTAPVKRRPAHQQGYIAYCPKGVLIAVNVADTSGKLENKHSAQGAFWSNDAVEIYFDTLNTKYGRRGEANTHQFFAFPFGCQSDPKSGGYESVFTMENGRLGWKKEKPAYPQEVMPRAGKKTDDGWTMEILIPKSVLRRGEIKPGRIIGFNLQIDTGTNIYYFWTCNIQVRTSMHPDTWGDVQFLGSDAKVEWITKDGKETTKSIVPGQPMRIRVTDPDMNLDDTAKDKVSVTVRTALGDTDTLILEETENESGIFEGAMATRLNIGAKRPNIVEVFEGETVMVEYIDQARAFGERNIPVKAKCSVSAIGSTLGR